MDTHEQAARSYDDDTLTAATRDLCARKIDKHRTDHDAVWVLRRREALQTEIRRRIAACEASLSPSA